MKEYVFVEFLFTEDEFQTEFKKLTDLGDDFVFLGSVHEWEDDTDYSIRTDYRRISGEINTMTASVIKLQNPALAGKMRISYISDELKNKYRR